MRSEKEGVRGGGEERVGRDKGRRILGDVEGEWLALFALPGTPNPL